MTSSRMVVVVLTFTMSAFTQTAGKNNTPNGPPPISKENRVEIVRSFATELVYARTSFPLGNTGLSLRAGRLTPSGPDLQKAIDGSGLAAKPGDLVRITAIVFKEDHIHFEINGGPTKNPKWYQRITVTGAGGTTIPRAPKNPNLPKESTVPARGSYVDLYFDGHVPELTASQLRELLRPVFDFDAKSPLEAYVGAAPPKVKDAVKNHRVLVGMNREMVIYAKGLPARKIRESEGGIEYEDWVYGEPPQDVEFVRIIGDEVVRIEVIRVNGEKIIRSEREID